MKKTLIFVTVFLLSCKVIASEVYSPRFIASFGACEPYTERTTINSSDGSIPLTKLVQGVVDHRCIYKQIILRPSVRDVTTCSFTKPMLEELTETMNAETGEKYNVNFDTGNQVVRLKGLTKSQILWTQYLNTEEVCKREIIPR